MHYNGPLQSNLWQTCCKLEPVFWHLIMQQINNPKPLVLMINITTKILAFQRCFFCFPLLHTLNMKSLWLEAQRHINYSHIWFRKQKRNVYRYLFCCSAITSSALLGIEESLFQTGIMGEHLKYLKQLENKPNISHVQFLKRCCITAIIWSMTMNSNAKSHGKFILVSDRFNAQVQRSFKLKLQESVEYF